jgi:hypothetical protein
MLVNAGFVSSCGCWRHYVVCDVSASFFKYRRTLSSFDVVLIILSTYYPRPIPLQYLRRYQLGLYTEVGVGINYP